jgi:hypothetical protein
MCMIYLGCGGSVQPVENFCQKNAFGCSYFHYKIAGSSIDCQFGSALLKSTSLNCNLLCREASELKACPLTFGIKLPPKANFLH